METKAFFKRWVAALRSGEYAQAAMALIRYDGFKQRFCCLGVAADLKRKDLGLDTMDDIVTGGIARTWLLPTKNQKTLLKMNDNFGMSFAEIADYIEKTYIKRKKSPKHKPKG